MEWDHSSRNGANYVGEDFMLATAADIVADLCPDARHIMEGREWIWDNDFKKKKLLTREVK